MKKIHITCLVIITIAAICSSIFLGMLVLNRNDVVVDYEYKAEPIDRINDTSLKPGDDNYLNRNSLPKHLFQDGWEPIFYFTSETIGGKTEYNCVCRRPKSTR